MIDTSSPLKIVSRKGNATATYFKESRRIIMVADKGCVHHAEAALHELSVCIPKSADDVHPDPAEQVTP